MSTESTSNQVPPAPSVADDAVGVPDRHWYVAIVNSRHEKKIAANLLNLSYESYVATQKERHLWKNGRQAIVDRVVITGVVFIHCTEQQRRQIVALPYINRFLTDRSSTQQRHIAVIPDGQMQKLRYMLGQSDHRIDFLPQTFRVHDRVRVLRGSLQGLTGEVTEAPDGMRTLTILISPLGCARLTISPADLEKIEE